MVSFAFFRLVSIISALAFASKVVCTPLAATEFTGLDETARDILERSQRVSRTTAAPHFVIYSDEDSGVTGPPPASQVKVRGTSHQCKSPIVDANSAF